MKRILLGLLICVLVVGVFYVSNRPQQRKIVVIGDLSGRYSKIGLSVRLGAEYAMTNEEIAKLFKIDYVNDEGKDSLAKSAALRAVADPSVLAVIGHSTSGNTGAAIDVYGPQSMPLFMPVATNPDLTISAKQAGWTNLYRLVPRDDFQASKIAGFCRDNLKVRRVMVLYDESRYGKTLGNSLRSALANQLIDVPKHLIIEKYIAGKVDYLHVAANVNTYMPDAVIFSGYYEEGGALVKDLRASGYEGFIILTDGCFQAEIFKEIGAKPGNVFVSFVSPDWNSVPTMKEFISWAKKKSKQADISYAPFAADGIFLLAHIVRELDSKGQKVDRNAIISYLRENRDITNGFLVGPYRFTDFGDNDKVRNHMYRLGANQTGEWQWVFLE